MSAEQALAATVSKSSVDADALVAELFATEARSLVSLARIFCDDRNSAEDLVQEAFIRLHRTAGTLRDRSRAPAFLRSIVINLARDNNRRGLMSFKHRSERSTRSNQARTCGRASSTRSTRTANIVAESRCPRSRPLFRQRS